MGLFGWYLPCYGCRKVPNPDCIQVPAPWRDEALESEAPSTQSEGGSQPLLNLRPSCPQTEPFFTPFYPSRTKSIFPDHPPAAPAITKPPGGEQFEISAEQQPSTAPSDLKSKDGDEFAEADRLTNSAARIGLYTSLFVASQWADKKNIFMTFFPSLFDNGTEAGKRKEKVITNPVVRTNRYAKGVNPLTGGIWGLGNIANVVSALSMLAHGNFADGPRFLWESTTNLANYISAHAHKNLAAAKAAQEGNLNPNKWWHWSIAKVAESAAEKKKSGRKKVIEARKKAAQARATSTGISGRWDLAKAQWKLTMANLARKDMIVDFAHLAPRVSPASGAAFAGMSFAGRLTRPDSAVNTAAMASDVASFIGLGLQFWGQEKEKFFKNHRLLAPLLPWLVRGGMLSWFAQIPGRFSDFYRANELMEQAAASMPERYRQYHGPQNWLTTFAHRYMDDPSAGNQAAIHLFPETGNMLFTQFAASMMNSGVPEALMQTAASAMSPEAMAQTATADTSTPRTDENSHIAQSHAATGLPIEELNAGFLAEELAELDKKDPGAREDDALSPVPSTQE